MCQATENSCHQSQPIGPVVGMTLITVYYFYAISSVVKLCVAEAFLKVATCNALWPLV